MECFLEIADQITADIVDNISDLSDEADDLETEVLSADADRDAKLRAEVSRQRRKVVSIRRYLVPMQNVYINMKNDKIDWLTDDNRRDLRELYNKATKAIEDLDYTRDHLLVSFEELQSKVNVRISRIMYFFSVVTVIFLPLTFVTGLLGINVEGIPFSDSEYAFFSVTGILILTAISLVWFLKKKKWI
jgi:zinc transporter